jgi:hypothetical protein
MDFLHGLMDVFHMLKGIENQDRPNAIPLYLKTVDILNPVHSKTRPHVTSHIDFSREKRSKVCEFFLAFDPIGSNFIDRVHDRISVNNFYQIIFYGLPHTGSIPYLPSTLFSLRV